MNKYAKEYIRSFANVVNQKNAVEPNLESMARGAKAVNNFGWGVYDFLKKPFIDSWQNVQDAKYLRSVGDNSAANAKNWSAVGNAALGTLNAVPFATAAKPLLAARMAAPAATSFIPRALNATKNFVKVPAMVGLYGGQGMISGVSDNKLDNSLVGKFESSSRQNYPEYSGFVEQLTKPSISSKDIIDTAIKPYNEYLSVNPITQGISEKVKQLPVKERIEKSLPYEGTLHEIQAMMSQ